MASGKVNGGEETGLSQADQIANLPPGLAMMKMQQDSIMAVSASRPRDLEAIKNELSETLKHFPVLAETAIYSKPVGKVVECKCNSCKHQFEAAVSRNADYVCPKCGDGKIQQLTKPRQKFARGLSIRAAEALQEAYGCNSTTSDVEPFDQFTVKVQSTFIDFQKATMRRVPLLVSKVYRTRGGSVQTIDDTRFNENVLKGAISKGIREVVTRSINPGMKVWFEAECERIQSGLLSDTKVDEIIAKFGDLKVTQGQIEELIGKPRANGWSDEDRKRLLGIYTGLKTGDLKIEELLADDDDSGNGKAAAPTGPVNTENLTGTNGATTGGTNGAGTASNGQGESKTEPKADPQNTTQQTGTQAGEPQKKSGGKKPEVAGALM